MDKDNIQAPTPENVANIGKYNKVSNEKEAPVDEEEANVPQLGPISSQVSEHAGQLFHQLNIKRKGDDEMMNQFKDTLKQKYKLSVSNLDGGLYKFYEEMGKIFEEKMHCLNEILQRTNILEGELQQFRKALGSLCKNFQD